MSALSTSASTTAHIPKARHRATATATFRGLGCPPARRTQPPNPPMPQIEFGTVNLLPAFGGTNSRGQNSDTWDDTCLAGQSTMETWVQ